MTWLEEIDKKIATNYELWIEHGDNSYLHTDIDGAIEDGERMARVLREQGEYIKLLDKKYNNALVLHYTHGMNTLDAELKVAYDNLSDDAKELCVAARENEEV